MSTFFKQRRAYYAACLLVGSGLAPVQAYELYSTSEQQLNFDVSANFGVFHSKKAYQQTGTQTAKSHSWREGTLKYGFSGSQQLIDASVLDAGLAWVSTATWGDGDAAGFTDGSERRTKIEDAWLRWRSGDLFPALGQHGLEVSGGRQLISVGDGFLINGDQVSFGQGLADGALDRGGAYYLAGRSSFSETAVVRLGGDEGWRSDLMWLKSDNRAQAKTGLYVATLEHVAEPGTLGFTFIKGKDVDKKYADDAQLERDGMKVYSLRGQGNLGVESLFLSAEYAWQDKRSNNNNAWYLEAGWTFQDVRWSPTLSYRYSRFSKDYDPLFYGFSRGFGTWFQGEVAANYAGPFNSNAKVHFVGLTAEIHDRLGLGLQFFDFSSIDRSLGDFSGNEVDLYLEWQAHPRLTVMPLLGLYKPKKSAEQGGSQLSGRGHNLYSQLIFSSSF